jgi:hypothetical protein
MIDHQQSQRVNKATEDTVSSFRETSQTVVESIITIQECYTLNGYHLRIRRSETPGSADDGGQLGGGPSFRLNTGRWLA